MKKQFRIRKRKEFVAARETGVCCKTKSILVQCVENSFGVNRVGVTASKKVGNSVVRNRCKRRMRALASCLLKESEQLGMDYVFIAKKSTAFDSWNTLVKNGKFAIDLLNKKI